MAQSRLPPSPALSKPTQTIRFFKDPFTLISQCRRELGDLFTLKLFGMGNWVFISNPDYIKEVFKASPEILTSGEVNAKLLGFMLGRDATFCLDGEAHLKRRKLMHPFFNGKLVLEKADLIRDVIIGELAKWPMERPFPFQPWSLRSSLAVVVNLFFGASKPDEIEEMTTTFEHFSQQGLRSPLLMMPFLQLNLGSLSPWGRVLETRRQTFAVFDRAIAERVADPERFAGRDVASVMASWRDENGERLSAESIRDEMLTDLFAGHETTGTTLSWCLERAIAYPKILERLLEELERVLGSEPIRTEHLRNLPFTMAFLDECFRTRPLGPTGGFRLVKEPFELGDYLIPAGTILVHSLPLFAEREEYFENHEVFNPDRFLEQRNIPYQWSPFGGGRRMCLGKGLAEVELTIALATILRRYHLKLAQPTVDRVRSGFFFAPSHDLRIEARPR